MTEKILIDKQVVEQALDALEARCGTNADERKPGGAIAALREALEVPEEEYEQDMPVVKPKLVSTSHTAELVTMLCCGIECPECGASFTVQASQTKTNTAEPAQQQPAEPVAKYIGECGDGSLVQLYDDVKKGTEFYTHPAPTQQAAPDAYNRKLRQQLDQEWFELRKLREAETQQPLTAEQCDAIYTALDEWSREIDAHDFGLPAIAGGGMETGREIIRAAHGITGSKKGGAA